MARDLTELDIKVLMLDGEHMAERCVVVALAITADGDEGPGRAVGRFHREQDRGPRAAGRPGRARPGLSTMGCWWSSTAPRRCRPRCVRCSATRRSIQRCTLHKRRNLADHLPDKEQAWVDAKLVKAFAHPDPDTGLRNAKQPCRATG